MQAVHHRKPKKSFATYVRRVLSTVDEEASIDSAALQVVSSMMVDLFDTLAASSKMLLQKEQQKQLNARHIVSAVKQTSLSAEKKLLGGITAAVEKHHKSVKGTQSERAGVLFPVGRIQSMFRNQNVASRVSPTAAVATAVVMQSVAEDLLKGATKQRKDAKVARITPHHVRLALDLPAAAHLARLFHGSSAIVAHGGVSEHIDAALLPKVSGKRKAEASAPAAVAASKKSKK
jgi:histone H2A